MINLLAMIKYIFILFLTLPAISSIECNAQIASSNKGVSHKSEIITGADQTEKYLPYLKGKRIGLVANQSSDDRHDKQCRQFIEPGN